MTAPMTYRRHIAAHGWRSSMLALRLLDDQVLSDLRSEDPRRVLRRVGQIFAGLGIVTGGVGLVLASVARVDGALAFHFPWPAIPLILALRRQDGTRMSVLGVAVALVWLIVGGAYVALVAIPIAAAATLAAASFAAARHSSSRSKS